MRRSIWVLALLAVLIAGLCVSTFANDTSKTPTKWSQRPNMLCGLDYSSQIRPDATGLVQLHSIVADDFLCLDGLPITDIHWWGSYWAKGPNQGDIYYEDSRGFAPPGGIQAFLLTIWSDVPKTTEPNSFSHPGEVLWKYVTTDFNETYFGNVPGQADVYQYFTLLPKDLWFRQEKGTIYWLSIESILPDPNKQWGWHESVNHWNDAAVQDFNNSGWYTLLGSACKQKDMAFELTTVPEPISLVLAVSGLGIVGTYFKSRKKA